MRPAHSIVLAACLTAGASLAPEQAPAPPLSLQEPFRTGVDLVHIDVSVLDPNDQPVRGLTAADFAIRENGRPQRVVAFLPMEVPAPVPVTASWMRDVGPDEQTTDLGAERFSQQRGADHAIALPLTRLAPGEYLLQTEAIAGTNRARTLARFSVG